MHLCMLGHLCILLMLLPMPLLLVAMAAQPSPASPPTTDRGIYRQYTGSPVHPLWFCTSAFWATIFSPM